MLGEVCSCSVCGTPLAAQSRRRGDLLIPTYTCRAGHVQRDRVDLDEAVGGLVVDYISKYAVKLKRPVKRKGDPGKSEVEATRLREKLAAMPALLAGDDALDPLDYGAAVKALRDAAGRGDRPGPDVHHPGRGSSRGLRGHRCGWVAFTPRASRRGARGHRHDHGPAGASGQVRDEERRRDVEATQRPRQLRPRRHGPPASDCP